MKKAIALLSILLLCRPTFSDELNLKEYQRDYRLNIRNLTYDGLVFVGIVSSGLGSYGTFKGHSGEGLALIGLGALASFAGHEHAVKNGEDIYEALYFKEYRQLKSQIRTSNKMKKVIQNKNLLTFLNEFQVNDDNHDYLKKTKFIGKLIEKLEELAKEHVAQLTEKSRQEAFASAEKIVASEGLYLKIIKLLDDSTHDFNVNFSYNVYMMAYYDAFVKKYPSEKAKK